MAIAFCNPDRASPTMPITQAASIAIIQRARQQQLMPSVAQSLNFGHSELEWQTLPSGMQLLPSAEQT
jgi:hypothetical protein